MGTRGWRSHWVNCWYGLIPVMGYMPTSSYRFLFTSSPRLYYLPPFFGFFLRKLYPHAVHAYNNFQAFLCLPRHCASTRRCIVRSVSLRASKITFRSEVKRPKSRPAFLQLSCHQNGNLKTLIVIVRS